MNELLLILAVLLAQPPGWITIDGQKHPEKIPQYSLWPTVFHSLRTLPREWLRTQLLLTPEEEDRLYAEGQKQIDRDNACAKRMEKMMATTPEKDQGRAYRALTLECRQADLDAAEALLASYPEETRDKVWEWVQSKRKTITIYLDPREADIFGVPR